MMPTTLISSPSTLVASIAFNGCCATRGIRGNRRLKLQQYANNTLATIAIPATPPTIHAMYASLSKFVSSVSVVVVKQASTSQTDLVEYSVHRPALGQLGSQNTEYCEHVPALHFAISSELHSY
mmetsp:Transcript_22389/g.35836  ORF Transcript_22389/g.35836 Transcript_22389/m.35836 type:complete len:124 (-) Transcript_22389:178-549(-)